VPRLQVRHFRKRSWSVSFMRCKGNSKWSRWTNVCGLLSDGMPWGLCPTPALFTQQTGRDSESSTSGFVERNREKSAYGRIINKRVFCLFFIGITIHRVLSIVLTPFFTGARERETVVRVSDRRWNRKDIRRDLLYSNCPARRGRRDLPGYGQRSPLFRPQAHRIRSRVAAHAHDGPDVAAVLRVHTVRSRFKR
jgi:hypothetical protein